MHPSWSSVLLWCAVGARPYPLRQGVLVRNARGRKSKAPLALCSAFFNFDLPNKIATHATPHDIRRPIFRFSEYHSSAVELGPVTPFWSVKRSPVQFSLFHPPIVFALTALCSSFSGTFLHVNSQRCSRRLCIYLFDIRNLTFYLERGGVIVSTMYISHVRTHVAHNHKFFIPVFCFWFLDCFNSWCTRCLSISLTFHRFEL